MRRSRLIWSIILATARLRDACQRHGDRAAQFETAVHAVDIYVKGGVCSVKVK